MKTRLSTLHNLRCAARALATGLPFHAEVDAFTDGTHFDGPRYYCLLRVPVLGPEWQEAGEAETVADALQNLQAALTMAACRVRRLESEFFPTFSSPAQNFSHEPRRLSVHGLLAAYRRADTAAEAVYARQRGYGASAPLAHNAAGATFRAKLRDFLS